MKEHVIANQGQPVYAISGGHLMSTSGAAVQEGTRQNEQSNTPSKKPSELLKQHVAQLNTRKEEKLSNANDPIKKERDDTKAKMALWRFIAKEAEKELNRKSEEEATAKDVVPPPPPVAQGEPIPKHADKPLLPKQYFTDVPSQMQNQIDKFCTEAKGIQLHDLDTAFLTYHYLNLHKQALEYNIAPNFLTDIEAELASRKVRVRDALRWAHEELQHTPVPGAKENDEDIIKYWKEKVNSGDVTEEQKDAYVRQRWNPDVKSGGRNDNDPPYNNLNIPGVPELNPIVEQVNRWSDDLKGDRDKVEAQINRVQRIVDEGRVTPAQAREVLEGLEGWQMQARTSERNRQAEERRAREEDVARQQAERAQDRAEYSMYGERRLTQDEKVRIRTGFQALLDGNEAGRKDLDELYNRIFERLEASVAEDFQQAFGNAGNYEKEEFFTELFKLRKNPDNTDASPRTIGIINELIERYDKEFTLRSLMHNAYSVAEAQLPIEKFVGFCSQFSSDLLDLALKGYPEVEMAYRIREQVLYQIKRENNGFIPDTMIRYRASENQAEEGSAFEKRTKKMMDQAYESGLLGDIPRWRLQRALTLSRGLGMVTLRFPEIVAECLLPVGRGSNQSQVSVPWETISWELNPLDHKIKRYEIDKEMRAILYFNLNNKGANTYFKSKGHRLSRDELETMMSYEAVSNLGDVPGVNRLVDIRNLMQIGSTFTHSTWRAYVAALNPDQKNLQPFLDSNPGIAAKILFDRHEYRSLDKLKNEKLDEWLAGNPNLNAAELNQRWNDYQKTADGKREVARHKALADTEDRRIFKETVRRMPHVMLRIISDKANKLMSESQCRALLREIFGAAVDSPEFQDIFTQTEKDLTFAKEKMMQRRRSAPVRGDTVPNESEEAYRRRLKAYMEEHDKLKEEDINTVITEDSPFGTVVQRQHRAKEMLRVMARKFDTDEALTNRILEKFTKKDFPFAITTEDVPLGEYNFLQAGGRGIITRRINDFSKDVEAGNEMINLIYGLKEAKSDDDIVGQMYKIFKAEQTHDIDRAREVTMLLARGIIRFYEKDSLTKIPIFGPMIAMGNALGRRGNSYAQLIYGSTAMEWDADDINNFIKKLRGLVLTHEQATQLAQETGGTLFRAMMKRGKVGFLLFLMSALYDFTSSLIKEK